jgi:hypothetical protein
MTLRRVGKIGVYGVKTRALQRRISFEAYGLTFKVANVYMYLGSRASDTPNINDIQSKVFFEIPDRAYADTPLPIPVGMEPLQEIKTDFSRFGLISPLQDETRFRFHIDDFEPLGREMIVGDVFELPFYTKNGDAFWEVTDVDLRSEAEKFIAIVTATPLSASRATREIPVNRDNGDIMELMSAGLEEELSKQIPAEGLYTETPDAEPVDYRNPLQASFLDDPNKQF